MCLISSSPPSGIVSVPSTFSMCGIRFSSISFRTREISDRTFLKVLAFPNAQTADVGPAYKGNKVVPFSFKQYSKSSKIGVLDTEMQPVSKHYIKIQFRSQSS